MPRTLRLPDGGYMRHHDIHHIINYLQDMHSVEVVGFSNIGKSALLRLLAETDVWVQEIGHAGQNVVPIYVDCNRMLEMSDQGFYEVILRSLVEANLDIASSADLKAAYDNLIAPKSEFQIPLSFNQGLTAVLQSVSGPLVLLMDEFDEPFSHIDPRVFLNLRALKDRYNSELVYVTATVEPLATFRQDEEHSSEFGELFRHRAWHLAPLTHPDTKRSIRRYQDVYDAPFIEDDYDFIYEWAGGHPTLLDAVCRMLEDALEAADEEQPTTKRREIHQTVARKFRSTNDILYECTKIWDTLDESAQEALTALVVANEEADLTVVNKLCDQHILRKVEGKPQFFCRIFADFVLRQVAQERPESASLWVDIDSGEVTIGGKPAETLTNLEYKLMLLLFQNADKIIDKFQIVTSVWGDSYIDEVDDARIEKLVSRLRQKIEPDPSNPVFLSTVRGRGYRLVLS